MSTTSDGAHDAHGGGALPFAPMPRGVEHRDVVFAALPDVGLPFAPMPKGVEHSSPSSRRSTSRYFCRWLGCTRYAIGVPEQVTELPDKERIPVISPKLSSLVMPTKAL